MYLDALDQFAKHDLKIGHYIRYVDDVVLVGESPGQVEGWEREMGAYLEEKLRLGWNAGARRMSRVANGCDFLGYIVYRNGLGVRRRTLVHCREKLALAERAMVRPVGDGVLLLRYSGEEVGRLRATVASYDGQFRHACADSIWRDVRAGFPFLRFFLNRTVRAGCPKWIRADSAPRRFPSLKRQYRWFARRFRRCLLFFGVGAFYEFYGAQRERITGLTTLNAGRWRAGLGVGVGLHRASGLARAPQKLAVRFPVAVVEPGSFPGGGVLQRKLARIFWPAGHGPHSSRTESNGFRYHRITVAPLKAKA